MTQWHLSWQEMFALEYREVVMCNGKHKHRADLCLPQPDGSKLIVEFQHSSISTWDICKREQFYTQFGHLLWVFDARRFHIRLEPTSSNSDIYKFTLSPPRKSLWVINTGLAFDFGYAVLLIAEACQRSGKRIKSGGWGWLYRKQAFATMLLSFTEQFTLDSSKPLWETKTRRATTPQLLAATKLVARAGSMVIESLALQELKVQLPNVNQLALRGALGAACYEAGYVKSRVNQQYSAWVKGI
ncbi:competence protein CoiA family protein [Fischerella sp. PCC 9605]|uniref:competence protein CoiA family protein n=1 Tax=Fischerella sp. PCC 9605 TaxID=1173024 RepID=UPI0004BAD557|nr:hypothetical protein [Fischerella sp. PCC 9605]